MLIAVRDCTAESPTRACSERCSLAHGQHADTCFLFSHVQQAQAGRNEQLCILALPADMGFAELCTFLGGYFPKVLALSCNLYAALGTAGVHQGLCGALHLSGGLLPQGMFIPSVDGSLSACGRREQTPGMWFMLCVALNLELWPQQVRELRLVRREGGASSLCSVLVRFEEQGAADDFYANYNGKPVGVAPAAWPGAAASSYSSEVPNCAGAQRVANCSAPVLF